VRLPTGRWILEFHTETIGNSIDEGKVAYDCAGIVDCTVVQASLTQLNDISDRYRRGALGEPIGVAQECTLAVADIKTVWRGSQETDQERFLVFRADTSRGQDPTETRSVMMDSVVALV
jgi:hypothetical protein